MRVAMKTMFAACLLTVSTGALAETKQLPIIDGDIATAEDFYGTVALIDGSGQFCTGTLVSPTVVVTAAHCLVDQDPDTDEVLRVYGPSEVFVLAAAVQTEGVPVSQAVPVAKLAVHSGYPGQGAATDATGIARQDDIAVLVLASAIDSLDVIAIPSVAEAKTAMAEDPFVIITGYGMTDVTDEELAGVLNIAETVLGAAGEYEFVVGAPGNPDSCKGDSGGPAYIEIAGEAALFGASSRAVENSNKLCGDGGLYTFVPAYHGWLAQNTDGAYVEPGATTDPDADPPQNPAPPEPEEEEDDGCAAGHTGAGPAVPATAWVFLALLGVAAIRRRRA